MSMQMIKKDNLACYLDICGIVLTNGIKDKNSDFGNGHYNDHNIHYGHDIHAASMLGKVNTAFMNKYGTSIDYLVSDVATAKSNLCYMLHF